MKFARIASRVFNAPLMIEPSRLAPITNYLVGRMNGQVPELVLDYPAKEPASRPESSLASQGMASRVFDDSCGLLTSEGIAAISITGELVQRPADMMDAKSTLLAYTRIEQRLDAALADPRVSGVLLEIDSPGGEAAGCFTLADKIYKARAVKPIWALVNESATSAAYALASAASRVLLTQGGQVGSIGVIMQALDQSKFDEAMGLQYAVISYGARKNDFNPHFPISEKALAWAQAEVTRLGEQFVGMVARNRGLDPAAVAATQAGIIFGPAAVEARLADAILEPPGAGQTLVTKAAAMLAEAQQKQFPGGSAAPAVARNLTPKGASLMDNEKSMAAGGAQSQPTGEVYHLKPGELEAEAATQAAALEAARAEGRAAGIAAERTRIGAILALPEAKGREEMALGLALESDMEAQAVGKILARAPKAGAANPLAEVMARIPNPDLGPDAPQAQGQGGNIMCQVMAERQGQGRKGAY